MGILMVAIELVRFKHFGPANPDPYAEELAALPAFTPKPLPLPVLVMLDLSKL